MPLPKIDDLARYAVRAETHPDLQHGNTDVQAVHRLYVPMELDGKIYRVKLTMKEYATGSKGGETALHALEAMEIESPLLGTVPSDLSTNVHLLTAQPTTGSAMSLQDLIATAQLQNGNPVAS